VLGGIIGSVRLGWLLFSFVVGVCSPENSCPTFPQQGVSQFPGHRSDFDLKLSLVVPI